MSQLEERECRFCGEKFRPKTNQQKCCCTRHGDLWRNRNHRQKDTGAEPKAPPQPVECVVCGRLFPPYRPNQVCCGPDCSKKRHQKKVNAYQRAVYQEQRQEEGPRQTTFGLNVDPYKTGRLRSDALYCPVI